MRRVSSVSVAVVLSLLSEWAGAAEPQAEASANAWDVLVRSEPELSHDPDLSRLERKILQVLTARQVERLAAGEPISTIVLPNGEDLESFIERTRAQRNAGLLYVPVEPCSLLDTRTTGEAISERRAARLFLHSDGSAERPEPRCPLPGFSPGPLRGNVVRALFLNVEVFEPSGPGRLTIWDGMAEPSPASEVVSYADVSGLIGFRTSAIVPVCDDEAEEPCGTGDLALAVRGADTHVALTLVGYFKLPATVSAWQVEGNDVYRQQGRVGIGTKEPRDALEIRDGARPALRLSNGQHDAQLAVAGNNGFYSPLATRGDVVLRSLGEDVVLDAPAGSVRVGTTGGERLTVTPEGRVGVGIADPGVALQVSGDVEASGKICDAVGCIGEGSGTLLWRRGAGGDIYFDGGRVGIGSDAPAFDLDLGGGALGGLLSIDGGGAGGQPFRLRSTTGQLFAIDVDQAGPDGAFRWLVGSGEGLDDTRMVLTAAGRLGVGTGMPRADLDVHGYEGVVFEGWHGEGFVPVSGPGTRLLWLPAKSALRAGTVDSDQWNAPRVGDYSLAAGLNPTASGHSSVALGSSTTASGDFGAVALGQGASASGDASFAAGLSTRAEQRGATALGAGSVASGIGSTASGNGSVASGQSATALGFATEAAGSSSTALGGETLARGDFSTALGEGSAATGRGALAGGQEAIAGGEAAISLGRGTIAGGNASTALGRDSVSVGFASLAAGFGTRAEGNASSALGVGTTATTPGSVVVGRYNEVSARDVIFVVGSGSETERANVIVVYEDGEVCIGTGC